MISYAPEASAESAAETAPPAPPSDGGDADGGGFRFVAQRMDDLILVEMHTADSVAAALVDETIARRMRDALDTALGRGFARPKPANGDA